MSLRFFRPLGSHSRALLEAVREWSDAFLQGAVELESEPIPEDDDYGLELILTLRPTNPEACSIELLATHPARGSTTGVFLDRWADIARKTGLSVRRKRERLVGLFVQPITLPVAKVLLICRQVAAGNVHLEVGVWRGRLVSTWGYVRLPSGRFKMSGCGDHWFWRPASKLGLAEIREVSYAPWS